MDKKFRKDLVREYADRKQPIGVYAVRCTATAQAWVGSTKNLDKKQNGLWFQLKTGSGRDKQMQAAWTAHGEASFTYEILEQLSEENPHTLEALLPEREAYWLNKLNATGLRGA